MKSMKGSRGRGQRPRSCNRSTGVSLIFRRSSIGFPLPQNWSEGPKFTFRGADDAGGADDSPHWEVVLGVLHMVRWGDVLFCEICSTRGAGSQTRAAIALPARRWSHVTSEHIVRPAKNLDICSDPIDGAYRQWSKVLRASKHFGHGIRGTGAEVLAPLVLRDKSI